MSVTIYNAVSLDGFIAAPNDDTSWVSEADWKNLASILNTNPTIIMGRKTYECSLEGDGTIPYGNGENFVFTHHPEKFKDDNVIFTNTPVAEFIKEKIEEDILVIGGGALNAELLKDALVDEVIVTVHPIILGDGVRQFAGIDFAHKTTLEKISQEDTGDGVVKIHYGVSKR